MRRGQLSIVLSMFAVFGSGIVVGAYGYHSYTAKTVSATAKPPANPEDWRRRYVNEMNSRLKLDDGQLASLNTILDETRARFKDSRERHKQEQKAEADRIRAEQSDKIRGMLTAAQKPEYDRFREERDRRMREEQAAKEAAAAKQQAGK